MSERHDEMLNLQKTICELLSPLAGDPRCQGMMVVMPWLSDAGLVTVSAVLPAKTEKAGDQMAQLMQQMVDGEAPIIAVHATTRPVRN